jgi:protein-L-isoaspartate(D-aspartate) O-methyltransferase
LGVHTDRAEERERMVVDQIEGRGVRDPAVLRAMRTVPRHRFVPAHLADLAYADRALPVELDQTISQPFIVARMAEAMMLVPGARVLDVGTGSGYAAAVLAEMGMEVWSIEIRPALAAAAIARLAALGILRVHVRTGDGTLGWPEHAPYDGIQVAASGVAVPDALVEQLALGAHLVLPIGAQHAVQELVRITRRDGGRVDRDRLGGVMFVPLVHTN